MFFDIKRVKRIIGAGLMVPVVGSVAACGASSDETGQDNFEFSISGLKSEDVSYEVPKQTPNILVDQKGFKTSSEKTVVFRGEELEGTFGIYDLDSGKLVYTGEISKPVFNEELGEYDSFGRFNDFDAEGSYFIRTGVVGESYSFGISGDYYAEILEDACKKYYMNRCGIAVSENYGGGVAHSACHTKSARLQEDPEVQIDVTGGWHMDEQAGRDTGLGCRIADNLLLAYEMNIDVFGDETGIPESGNNIPDILDEVRYEAQWLLKMQDTRTGGIYGAAVTDTSGGSDIFTAPVVVTPVSMDATIGFASMMARFSYCYQQFDPDFATTCLKAADRAWTCFLNNKKAIDETAAYKAAAQLYRATGSDTYHEVIKSFFAKSDFFELFENDENIFMGSVSYMSTNQSVDREMCESLMKALMKKASGVAERAGKSPYLVCSGAGKKDFDGLLSDMRCLTITDHIIYNHEYTTIIENHVHYLMGMNPEAVNYVTDDTERTYADTGDIGIMNDPGRDALFIIMLSVL
ncbi:MAG: glycoside hydrolase family 9 protein [Butyrivibrio sp.]|nr:glycoside hydrolase family 9 protein [Butyrivibrio sp.]